MDNPTPHLIADPPPPEAAAGPRRPGEPPDLRAYLLALQDRLLAEDTQAGDLVAATLNPLIRDVRNHMTGDSGIDAETYLARKHTPSWDPHEGRGVRRCPA